MIRTDFAPNSHQMGGQLVEEVKWDELVGGGVEISSVLSSYGVRMVESERRKMNQRERGWMS